MLFGQSGYKYEVLGGHTKPPIFYVLGVLERSEVDHSYSGWPSSYAIARLHSENACGRGSICSIYEKESPALDRHSGSLLRIQGGTYRAMSRKGGKSMMCRIMKAISILGTGVCVEI